MRAMRGALRADLSVATSSNRDALDVFDGLNATACSFYSSQAAPELHNARYQLIIDLYVTRLDLAQHSRGSIQATAAVLVVANRITGQVVESDVLKALESFWGQVILETIAAAPLQA
ncbi:unnamed protein product [Phytophthora lilii]|uniref:Unnamed protein product n=1 Tax=Phytophthora lilii TaxID=2077276 RepID=A0A9W6TLF5_9STRA|nr:unnamed protein product [Phytophthora lilii]